MINIEKDMIKLYKLDNLTPKKLSYLNSKIETPQSSSAMGDHSKNNKIKVNQFEQKRNKNANQSKVNFYLTIYEISSFHF